MLCCHCHARFVLKDFIRKVLVVFFLFCCCWKIFSSCFSFTWNFMLLLVTILIPKKLELFYRCSLISCISLCQLASLGKLFIYKKIQSKTQVFTDCFESYPLRTVNRHMQFRLDCRKFVWRTNKRTVRKLRLSSLFYFGVKVKGDPLFPNVSSCGCRFFSDLIKLR